MTMSQLTTNEQTQKLIDLQRLLQDKTEELKCLEANESQFLGQLSLIADDFYVSHELLEEDLVHLTKSQPYCELQAPQELLMQRLVKACKLKLIESNQQR